MLTTQKMMMVAAILLLPILGFGGSSKVWEPRRKLEILEILEMPEESRRFHLNYSIFMPEGEVNKTLRIIICFEEEDHDADSVFSELRAKGYRVSSKRKAFTNLSLDGMSTMRLKYVSPNSRMEKNWIIHMHWITSRDPDEPEMYITKVHDLRETEGEAKWENEDYTLTVLRPAETGESIAIFNLVPRHIGRAAGESSGEGGGDDADLDDIHPMLEGEAPAAAAAAAFGAAVHQGPL
jgi:hypothetical protein